MIKLKKMININESEVSDKNETFTYSEINDIYNLLSDKRQFNIRLYRAIKENNFDYRLARIREDRILKDTPNIINAIWASYFNEQNYGIKIPDRKKCLFSTNVKSEAERYGNLLTLIFPGKNSKVIYNINVYDSYNITETFAFMKNSMLLLLENEKFYDVLQNNKKFQEYNKFINILIDYYNRGIYDDLISFLHNINFKLVIKELNEIIEYKFNNDIFNNDIKSILDRQIKFFDDLDNYGKNVKYLNEKDKFKTRTEFIIYGPDEYLQVNANKFLNSFKWDGNKWIPKN